VLVTCSTGLGFEFARHLDSLGFTVFAGCLDDNSDGARALRAKCSKRIHVLQANVTIDSDILRAKQYVQKNLPQTGKYNRVSILVNR